MFQGGLYKGGQDCSMATYIKEAYISFEKFMGYVWNLYIMEYPLSKCIFAFKCRKNFISKYVFKPVVLSQNTGLM